MKQIPYEKQPCDRCGSKRIISKTWFESIPTTSGTTQVECSQIICTNIVCQTAFDENLAKETKKRLEIRLVKEKRDSLRKASSLLEASKSHKKSKSRI